MDGWLYRHATDRDPVSAALGTEGATIREFDRRDDHEPREEVVMLRATLSVCAETVIRDVSTNTISVVNIIEEISVKTFPITLPRLSCLFMISREADDPSVHHGLVRILDTGVEITSVPVVVDFKDKLLNRNISIVGGVPIQAPGELRVEMRVAAVEIGSWSIPVRQIGGPEIHVQAGDPEPQTN